LQDIAIILNYCPALECITGHGQWCKCQVVTAGWLVPKSCHPMSGSKATCLRHVVSGIN